MQISIKPVRRNESGWVLTVTLTFLVVTLIVFASIMYWVSSNARLTQRNNLFTISQAAAQGATEITIAQMDRDFIYQSINNSNVYMPLVTNIDQSSWPVKFTFSDTNGNANQIAVSIYPQNWATNFVSLNSQFTGLYAAVAQCDLYAMATTTTNAGYNMSAIVHESVQLAAIPVFQFGVFYNLDLDIGNGAAMTMNGKVHCNGTIWMCPQALMTFNDLVEASVIVTNKDNPNDQQNHTFSSSNLKYVITVNNPVSGADTLSMPISGVSSANLEAIINIPTNTVAAPNPVAYYPTNQVYLYNECDLIISNSSSGISGAFGTNITIYYQDPVQLGGPWFQLTNNEVCTFSNRSAHTVYTTNSPYSFTPATNFIQLASGFPFVTNVSFFDFREGDTVQAVQINVSQLNSWLQNTAFEGNRMNQYCGGVDGAHGNKGHPIDSIFIYNNVPRTYSQLPAVRMFQGTQLPSHWGLTIATPMPIYVVGNYNVQTNASHQSVLTTNTAWTWPAALMGDAITILSSQWNDAGSAYVSGGALSSRTTLNTTVNAACFEGIVPCTKVGSTKHYSGGLENFLRLLENWNTTLCYNGSIVVMFPSIIATNYWQPTGNYYNAPTRQWGFDANFTSQSKMPPCAPQAKALIRGNWDSKGK